MATYEMHVDSTDMYAANVIAGKQAYRDGMPVTGERHAAIATHIKNAGAWASAYCPPGHRVKVRLVFEHVPDVNPVYNFSRGDLYRDEAAAGAVA